MGWEVGGRFKRKERCILLCLIHVDTWQKPTQYCKVIILQIKINKKRTENISQTCINERKRLGKESV